MGARDYVTQRSDQIDQGKTDVLTAIEGLHAVQRVVMTLRQKVQVERLRESDGALSNAMQENVAQLAGLEKAFDAVVGAVEALPQSFEAVDAAEKRLAAALPSTVAPPSSGGPPASS